MPRSTNIAKLGGFLTAAAVILLFAARTVAQCSANPSASHVDPQVEAAYARHDWPLVLQLSRPPSPSPDLNFLRGMALAHLNRWPEARTALLAGAHQCPHQKRFPIELAGVAFQQKRYAESAAWLRKGLKLDPTDAYANNFAGTVYYLLGNLDAALHFWNRVQRPQLAALRFDPQLRLQRLILDRSFAFSPAATLQQKDYETTLARLQSLGLYPAFNIVLNARPDGSYDAEFHAIERNGFGSTRVQALISTFAGAAYQTIYPAYYNLNGSDLNLQSLLRWDDQKRRAWVSVSAPVRALPQWRWQLSTDERNENWVIRRSFTGDAPALGSLNLERQAVDASVTAIPDARLQWSTGAQLSHRTYRNVNYGTALTPQLVSPGFQFTYRTALKANLLNLPEKRLALTSEASSQTARRWSAPSHLFEKIEGSAHLNWLPQAQGDRYQVSQQLRAGGILGSAPFDELYLLGMERDTSLWLRGQIGTRDGRKGSSPLGASYLLSNSAVSRRIYGNGLFAIHAGPIFDMAKVSAPTPGLSTPQWIFDAGVEARLAVLGTSVVFTWGRDLRQGTNAFYGTLAQ